MLGLASGELANAGVIAAGRYIPGDPSIGRRYLPHLIGARVIQFVQQVDLGPTRYSLMTR